MRDALTAHDDLHTADGAHACARVGVDSDQMARQGRHYGTYATAAGMLQGLQALSPRQWPPLGAFIKLPALRVVHDFVELQLLGVYIAKKIGDKGPKLLGRFHQPLQDGVGVDFKHPSGRTDAQAYRQAGQHPHDQLHRQALAVQERAMGLQEIAVTRTTVQLAPWATTRMAHGAEVA